VSFHIFTPFSFYKVEKLGAEYGTIESIQQVANKTDTFDIIQEIPSCQIVFKSCNSCLFQPKVPGLSENGLLL
jgi:hypothetical protein